MRLLIASDIHGSASQMVLFKKKAAEFSPDKIIILGDILYHGPRNPLPDGYNPPEVVRILSEFGPSLLAVKGNCDGEVDQYVLPFHLAESLFLMDSTNQPLWAIHGHQLEMNGGQLKPPINGAVLSGHTHLPTAEYKDGLHLWNPGSISLPKGGHPPSFGFYEDGHFTVFTFEGQELATDKFVPQANQN